jgi:hypothetical protein
MEKILFKEEQKFGPMMQLILLPGLIFTIVIFGIGFYKQLYLGEPWGNEPMSDTGLIVAFIFVLVFLSALSILFIKMKLITEIRSDGIYFKYPPIINKFKDIKPDSIERFEVRKYNAIREYGGYGIKGVKHIRRRRSKGIAYNVSGNTGLQLYLKDGRKILIGTQRSEAIRYAMNKMMKTE